MTELKIAQTTKTTMSHTAAWDMIAQEDREPEPECLHEDNNCEDSVHPVRLPEAPLAVCHAWFVCVFHRCTKEKQHKTEASFHNKSSTLQPNDGKERKHEMKNVIILHSVRLS